MRRQLLALPRTSCTGWSPPADGFRVRPRKTIRRPKTTRREKRRRSRGFPAPVRARTPRAGATASRAKIPSVEPLAETSAWLLSFLSRIPSARRLQIADGRSRRKRNRKPRAHGGEESARPFPFGIGKTGIGSRGPEIGERAPPVYGTAKTEQPAQAALDQRPENVFFPATACGIEPPPRFFRPSGFAAAQGGIHAGRPAPLPRRLVEERENPGHVRRVGTFPGQRTGQIAQCLRVAATCRGFQPADAVPAVFAKDDRPGSVLYFSDNPSPVQKRQPERPRRGGIAAAGRRFRLFEPCGRVVFHGGFLVFWGRNVGMFFRAVSVPAWSRIPHRNGKTVGNQWEMRERHAFASPATEKPKENEERKTRDLAEGEPQPSSCPGFRSCTKVAETDTSGDREPAALYGDEDVHGHGNQTQPRENLVRQNERETGSAADRNAGPRNLFGPTRPATTGPGARPNRKSAPRHRFILWRQFSGRVVSAPPAFQKTRNRIHPLLEPGERRRRIVHGGPVFFMAGFTTRRNRPSCTRRTILPRARRRRDG